MNVQEAATLLNVTPRRVRAMIADGRISAHREGAVWVVHELTPPKGRRSLSPGSWRKLAHALKQRTLEGLSGQERSRTATRIRQLRDSADPSRLLLEWFPKGAERDVFMDSLLAHAKRRDNDYLKRTLVRPTEYLRSSQDLAQVVASERAIRGGSRRWLAEAAGVPKHLVRDIETGRSLSSPKQVRQVLSTLDIEPTALPGMVLS